VPPVLPYGLDADIAGLRLVARDGGLWLADAGTEVRSIDPARRLFKLWPSQELRADAGDAIRAGKSYGTLASAALLLGAGRGLLEASAVHAKTREQFGRPIGAFQAVKHSLANVLIGLEFARPLLYAAAIALGNGAPTAARDLSAARVASADAARLAARTALQVHGAIGYTRECDVSLWLAKVRALSSTWGSQAEHRAVVLAALTEPRTGPWS
jgi:alkylation response protein AidB-like acyl-CoA dehydrogenase